MNLQTADGRQIKLTQGEMNALGRLLKSDGTKAGTVMYGMQISWRTMANLHKKGVLDQDVRGNYYLAEGIFDTSNAPRYVVHTLGNYRYGVYDRQMDQHVAEHKEYQDAKGHAERRNAPAVEQTPRTSDFKFYRTDENGVTRKVENRDALLEISAAQMDTHHMDCSVEEMTYSNGNAVIKYTDGRLIRIRRIRKTKGTIVEFNGKKYVTGNVVPKGDRGAGSQVNSDYVHYWWSVRDGKPFGVVRSASDNSKPGTVGHAIWQAVKP